MAWQRCRTERGAEVHAGNPAWKTACGRDIDTLLALDSDAAPVTCAICISAVAKLVSAQLVDLAPDGDWLALVQTGLEEARQRYLERRIATRWANSPRLQEAS
jgi:hypothetical protein